MNMRLSGLQSRVARVVYIKVRVPVCTQWSGYTLTLIPDLGTQLRVPAALTLWQITQYPLNRSSLLYALAENFFD
jgi:hypothetical protein